MATPQTQKAGVRPISFVLIDNPTGDVIQHDLNIRPEDLTRVEPSRATVTQTFGGAWVDSWGTGLAEINISGHTGWRGTNRADGADTFVQLKSTVFDEWHRRRRAAIIKGDAPDQVKLVFVDALDNFSYIVVPMSFTLKRNRSRPLLSMYQISMVAVTPDLGNARELVPQSQSDPTEALQTGFDSMSATIGDLGELQSFVGEFGAGIDEALGGFMSLASDTFTTVLDLAGTALGIITEPLNQLYGIASAIASAGYNACMCYLSVAGMVGEVAFRMMQIASVFGNAMCLFASVFFGRRQYQNYDDLYGASFCSSTFPGGSPISPLAAVNPFGLLVPQPSPLILVSPEAQIGLTALASCDPVLFPQPQIAVTAYLGAISVGVSLPL